MLSDLTRNVRSCCYTHSAGDGGKHRQDANLVASEFYSCPMILEADMDIEQIDEALMHLSETIRASISEQRRNALMDLVDALLDAKLEKSVS